MIIHIVCIQPIQYSQNTMLPKSIYLCDLILVLSIYYIQLLYAIIICNYTYHFVILFFMYYFTLFYDSVYVNNLDKVSFHVVNRSAIC